jgi:16S rRNA processing protein RimM
MKKVLIAKILKPQGLRGEVKINPYNKKETSLKEGVCVYLNNNNTLTIRTLRERAGFLYATFENYNSIEAVEPLRGEELFILEEDLNTLDEDEFYVKDLIGCTVLLNSGAKLGNVTEIENYGANDVYTVRNSQKQEVLFALVDGLILEVNLDKKQIIVDEKVLNEVII